MTLAPPNSGAPDCTLVLFGATGDLTRRKLIPALLSLEAQGLLPNRCVIVAFARKPFSDESFRDYLASSLATLLPDLVVEPAVWQKFARRIVYHCAEIDRVEGYRSLQTRLMQLESSGVTGPNRLFYLATPPDHFVTITEHIGASGLSESDDDGIWRRLIVEKPFGVDLDSALALNSRLRSVFSENQIYRIDHYLGKETVQNILVLRFANRLFEFLWNHLYIDSVQITVAETLGIEGRANYFDQTGVTRDIIQNHALQVLSLIAMEPPVRLDADSVRDEKVKVLKSIRHMDGNDVRESTVRGQYAAHESGSSSQASWHAYLEEPGVSANSHTETFVALRFWVDNWRWNGVPFYVRSGKRLPKRVTEVVIQLKDVPDVLYSRLACGGVQPNLITIRIQPNEGVDIVMSAKVPGPAMEVRPVRMHFDYQHEFDKDIPDAYERLLLNAMLGDAALFARDDEVETAWQLITPILDYWRTADQAPYQYSAGSWGPDAADKLLRGDGRRWWNPQDIK